MFELKQDLTSGGITRKTKNRLESIFNEIRWTVLETGLSPSTCEQLRQLFTSDLLTLTISDEEITRLGGVIDDDSAGRDIAGMSRDVRYKLGAILSTLTEVLRVQAGNSQVVGLCKAAESSIDALEKDLERLENDYLILKIKESREASDIPEPVEIPPKVEKEKPGTLAELRRGFKFELLGLIGVLDDLILQRGHNMPREQLEEMDDRIFAVADAISDRSKSFINLVEEFLDSQPAAQDLVDNQSDKAIE